MGTRDYGKFMLSYKTESDVLTEIYHQFPNEKVIGAYFGLRPVLIVKDPELVKTIMIKDFDVFTDRGFKKVEGDLFEHNLFAIEGYRWKWLRKRLTPIFTSGKIKNMMPLIQKCVDQYLEFIDEELTNSDTLEVRNLSGKLTLQVIGSCAFGMELETFGKDQNLFMEIANEIFTPKLIEKIVHTIDIVLPIIAPLSKLNLLPSRVRVRNFFMSLVSKIINEREGKPKTRKDFMDLLIELKEQERTQSEKDVMQLSPALIAAQDFAFYAAGFDTSSGAMSFLIHELAFNQEIQERAHQEVTEVFAKNNGVISYEALSDLKYLDMCFSETLRKYPIIGVLNRESNANYKIKEADLVIEKGTMLLVPTLAIQTDHKHYKAPEEFKPERFSPENRSKIIPGTYIPFGEGPRNCIGMRFAIVESLVAMAHLIARYKFEPTDKTPRKFGFDPRGITLMSDVGLWVKFTRR